MAPKKGNVSNILPDKALYYAYDIFSIVIAFEILINVHGLVKQVGALAGFPYKL